MLLTSLKTHLTSLGRKAKTSLEHLMTRHGVSNNSERHTKLKQKNKKMIPSSSAFDLPAASSFATMGVSSQLKQVFKVIDTNGDGKISSHELSRVLFCLGSCKEKSKAELEAQVMIKEMDCNGDGFIDLDEFVQALISEDGKALTEEDYNILRDAFLIFDADKNGLISAKELQKVLVGLGWDKCGLEECRRMIEGVDKDGDGFVDFDEFRSMMEPSTR